MPAQSHLFEPSSESLPRLMEDSRVNGMLTTNAGGAEGPGAVTALSSVVGGDMEGGAEGPGAVTALTSIAGGDMGGGASPPSFTETRPCKGQEEQMAA